MGVTKDIWITASALSMVLAMTQTEAADADTKSGIAAYVRPPVTGSPSGGPERRLRVGDSVFHNEKVATGPGGRIQLIMLDKTTLTLGPDSELLINEYAYDELARDGSMTITASKGLFRFVGGLVSKNRPVKVRVPTGTIGIRGAIVTIQMLPNGGVRLIFLYGDEATYEGDNGESASLSRGDDVLTINPDGSIEITQVTQENLADMQTMLTGTDNPDLDVKTSISDAAGQELIESINRHSEDPLLNIRILEETLDLDGADYEEVRELLRDLQEAGSGGGLNDR